jgi:hypothetical protein
MSSTCKGLGKGKWIGYFQLPKVPYALFLWDWLIKVMISIAVMIKYCYVC